MSYILSFIVAFGWGEPNEETHHGGVCFGGVAIVTAGWEEIQRGTLSISSCTSSLWCLEPLALWMTFKSCAITPTRG